jgi:hypothetical protein
MVAAMRSRGHTHGSSGPKSARNPLARWRATAREFLLGIALGNSGLQALELGRFWLTSGQVSYRMYDRHSLEQLFLNAGFSAVFVRTPKESGYGSWQGSNLDVDSPGQPARPHTLIMEGIRSS